MHAAPSPPGTRRQALPLGAPMQPCRGVTQSRGLGLLEDEVSWGVPQQTAHITYRFCSKESPEGLVGHQLQNMRFPPSLHREIHKETLPLSAWCLSETNTRRNILQGWRLEPCDEERQAVTFTATSIHRVCPSLFSLATGYLVPQTLCPSRWGERSCH